MEFFRFCPSSGRRFHIKLVSKKAVRLERQERRETQAFGRAPSFGPGGTAVQWMTIVREGEPIIVDVEEFQYNYKCKHCGHEWSEKACQRAQGKIANILGLRDIDKVPAPESRPFP